MEGDAAIRSILFAASQEAVAEPGVAGPSNEDHAAAAALEDEIEFVASFMKALAQGVSKGKEDKDLIRQRKERKRQVNRASAKRKRARAKQDFDNLAAQCQLLEESNRQLKNENARLAGVVRDELEKQAMYMAQIEYIKAALQQQQAASQGNANSSESGAATVGAQATPVQPSTVPPTPILPYQSGNQAPAVPAGVSTQQVIHSSGQDLQQQVLQGEQHSAPQQELPPQTSQQQLQALANFILASSTSSQSVAGSTVPGSSAAAVNASAAPTINQETLNQLQTLLTALASQNPPSNPPAATASATATAAAAPAPVHNPLVASLGAMNPEATPQLNTLLSALVTASAALTGNPVFASQPMSGSTTQGSSGELYPSMSQEESGQAEPRQPAA